MSNTILIVCFIAFLVLVAIFTIIIYYNNKRRNRSYKDSYDPNFFDEIMEGLSDCFGIYGGGYGTIDSTDITSGGCDNSNDCDSGGCD
jgi:heme/copper-type cytochrome/quinol oxidase subunit 2